MLVFGARARAQLSVSAAETEALVEKHKQITKLMLAIEFSKSLEDAVPLICNLLGSSTNSGARVLATRAVLCRGGGLVSARCTVHCSSAVALLLQM